jgi:hypothetical protein
MPMEWVAPWRGRSGFGALATITGMTTTLGRPTHIEVHTASTLRRRPARRPRSREIIAMSLRVFIAGAIFALMLRLGPADSFMPTLFFGGAAIVYLMATFMDRLSRPDRQLID